MIQEAEHLLPFKTLCYKPKKQTLLNYLFLNIQDEVLQWHK